MTTPRARKPRPKPSAKPATDPKSLLPKLRARLEQERAGLGRWQKRLVRTFRAWERHHRQVTRLERRIAELSGA
jgi:hypothetical protein